MNTPMDSAFEERVRQTARSFGYPKTPDVSRVVRARVSKPQRADFRLVLRFVVIAIVVLFAFAMAIPQVRAEILGFFKIGAVNILPYTPTAPSSPITATPISGTTPLPYPLNQVAGLTTLDDAHSHLRFPIRLPAYPPDLGKPEYVYYQKEFPMVILVWLEPNEPGKIRLSLNEIDSKSMMVNKYEPVIVQETTVNGSYAVWAEGPYLIQLKSGDYNLTRFVQGHTLIWQDATTTYRLETDLSLDEARKIAESLK